jgi:predicted nucleotidyltransferase
VTIELPDWLHEPADELGYPAVFVTVSGAHLYGFASVDSDIDLRAAHVLPATEVVGLETGPETLQFGGVRHGVELDIVSHDLAKFLRLLLRPNGYVLEQLLSPLVVRTSPLHDELRALAPACLTRHHARHYLGFAQTQWALFERTGELKPALYTLRVLLSGIELMRNGQVQADLRQLCDGHDLPYVPDLIAAKRAGEHNRYPSSGRDQLARDVARLRADLEVAATESTLPEKPSAREPLNDLLIRARLGGS